MKSFDEDYFCEGQMNIFDFLQQDDEETEVTESVNSEIEYKESVSESVAAASEPNTCCGLVPWLQIHKCYSSDIEANQAYKMYYICPNCFKVPTDGTEWIDRSYGTYETAKKRAIRVWNNPRGIKYENNLRIFFHDAERFKEQYNFQCEDRFSIVLQKGSIKA